MSLDLSILDHKALVERTDYVLASCFDPAATMLANALVEGNKIMVCGNGGSACDAQHLAAELVVRFKADRRPWPALALTDSAILTAASNDYEYSRVFSRQVEAYGKAGDVLIAISTSGKSKNVLEAIAAAKRLGVWTLGLSGNNPLGADVDVAVPSLQTARVQEMHILIAHLLVEELERRLPAR